MFSVSDGSNSDRRDCTVCQSGCRCKARASRAIEARLWRDVALGAECSPAQAWSSVLGHVSAHVQPPLVHQVSWAGRVRTSLDHGGGRPRGSRRRASSPRLQT